MTCFSASRREERKPKILEQSQALLAFVNKYSTIKMKKGEFETTEQYKERLDRSGFTGKHFAVNISPKGALEYHYDADTRVLRISVKNAQDVPLYSDDIRDMDYNALFLISSGSKKTGGYIGQNAYGAKAYVDKIRKDQVYVVATNIKKTQLSDWQNYDESERRRLGMLDYDVSADPETAKQIIEKGICILTITTEFYYGQQSYIPTKRWYQDATISSPTELTKEAKILPARVKCIEVINPVTGSRCQVFSDKDDMPTIEK